MPIHLQHALINFRNTIKSNNSTPTALRIRQLGRSSDNFFTDRWMTAISGFMHAGA